MTKQVAQAHEGNGGPVTALFVSVPEAARISGLSETTIREASNRGDLFVKWYGRGRGKRLIGYQSLTEWLYALPDDPDREAA